jgi:hypothetical protein
LRAQLSVHKDLQRQREGIRSALNNTSTSTVHNNHRHNHRRVVFLDSNQENHSNDSQYDEQISNTTALPVIAPPAPFPFLRPGNQKASKQAGSPFPRPAEKQKAKSEPQPVRMQSCAFEPQRLTAPARTLALAVQQLAEAQPRSHHHHHLTSNATRPRAATSPSSASGESQGQTNPRLLPPGKKAKSQKHKNRAYSITLSQILT